MKEKQTKRSKVLFIINTLMLIMLFAIPLYAYWAGAIGGANKDTTTNIEIGKGETVETVITLTELNENYGVLVPEGRAVTGQTEQITFNLVFTWEEATDDNFTEGDTHSGKLTLTSAVIGTDLLNVAFTPPETIQLGVSNTVAVTITLTEPATKADYDALQAATIGLTFTFSVEVV